MFHSPVCHALPLPYGLVHVVKILNREGKTITYSLTSRICNFAMMRKISKQDFGGGLEALNAQVRPSPRASRVSL